MIQLKVNGAPRQFDGDPDMPLLWYLRDVLEMTGTKYGCGAGLCGACTVHVNGAAQRSCQLRVGSLGHAKITTIEHIGDSQVGARLQEAWLKVDVMQCGYCQAGQIMSAAALLTQTPRPTLEQINSAMAGNVCRCACYNRIQSAIRIAAGIQEDTA